MKWVTNGSPDFTQTFNISSDKGWVTVELPVTTGPLGTSANLSFKSAGGNNNYGVQLDAVSVNRLSFLATPSLMRVVATGGSSATLVGRVDGAPSQPLTLQAYACTNGVPNSTPITDAHSH